MGGDVLELRELACKINCGVNKSIVTAGRHALDKNEVFVFLYQIFIYK